MPTSHAVLPFAATAVLAAAGCVAMNPSVVEPDRYLGARQNPAGIYAGAGAPVLLPVLDVRIEPIDRLVLVSIADDPVYAAVELRVFAGVNGGEYARVLVERGDTVDVYDLPGSGAPAADRHTLEALFQPRVVTMQERTFEYRFRVTRHGLDAALQMVDRTGREIAFDVVETRDEPVLGALIAPLGSTSARPDFLPVFFLDEFAMVRRRGAKILITVDGATRLPAKLPRLVRGPASYFTRYSTRPVIAHWNERRDVRLDPVSVPFGTRILETGELEWWLVWNEGQPEVESAIARAGDDAVTFLFSPALPNLPAMSSGARVQGRFVINVNDVDGVVAGDYEVVRSVDAVEIVFQPLRAWQPPMVRGRPWVATYRYEATIDLGGEGAWLRSTWRRQGNVAVSNTGKEP